VRRGAIDAVMPAPELVRWAVDELSSRLKGGEWLDVGGGIGALADLVRRTSPAWNVTLNELNPRSIELAEELFGLKAAPDLAETLQRNGRKFDVISSSWVLEHVPDPHSFVCDYADLLRPGGIMTIMIPQFTRLNATVSRGTSDNVAPPFHLSLFHRSNLAKLLERTGRFDEVEIGEWGPPTFFLLHHVDYEDYWDISVPTAEHPTPTSVKLLEYPQEIAERLNALAKVDPSLREHFRETDGRQYVIAFCRRAEGKAALRSIHQLERFPEFRLSRSLAEFVEGSLAEARRRDGAYRHDFEQLHLSGGAPAVSGVDPDTGASGYIEAVAQFRATRPRVAEDPAFYENELLRLQKLYREYLTESDRRLDRLHGIRTAQARRAEAAQLAAELGNFETATLGEVQRVEGIYAEQMQRLRTTWGKEEILELPVDTGLSGYIAAVEQLRSNRTGKEEDPTIYRRDLCRLQNLYPTYAAEMSRRFERLHEVGQSLALRAEAIRLFNVLEDFERVTLSEVRRQERIYAREVERIRAEAGGSITGNIVFLDTAASDYGAVVEKLRSVRPQPSDDPTIFQQDLQRLQELYNAYITEATRRLDVLRRLRQAGG
jgi:SAM-dependent methyltransferase